MFNSYGNLNKYTLVQSVILLIFIYFCAAKSSPKLPIKTRAHLVMIWCVT